MYYAHHPYYFTFNSGHAAVDWRKLLRKAEIILHTAPEIADVATSSELLPPVSFFSDRSSSLSSVSSSSSTGSGIRTTPTRPSDIVVLASQQLVQNTQVLKDLIKPKLNIGWTDIDGGSTPTMSGGKRLSPTSPGTTQLTHIRRRINIADSVDDDSS